MKCWLLPALSVWRWQMLLARNEGGAPHRTAVAVPKPAHRRRWRVRGAPEAVVRLGLRGERGGRTPHPPFAVYLGFSPFGPAKCAGWGGAEWQCLVSQSLSGLQFKGGGWGKLGLGENPAHVFSILTNFQLAQFEKQAPFQKGMDFILWSDSKRAWRWLYPPKKI